MSLRGFILAISTVTILGIVGLFYLQSQKILGGAFSDLEKVHLDTVAQTAQSLIDAKKFSLRTYRSALENNNSLSSILLVGSVHRRAEKIVSKLSQVQAQLKVDLLDYIPNRSVPIRLGEISPLAAQPGEWKIAKIQGELSLISFSPVRHYGEVIGTLAIGVRLNALLAQEIAKTTKVKVHFTLPDESVSALPAFFRIVTIDDSVTPPLQVRANIDTNFISDVNQSTRSGITWLGIVSLLLVLILISVLLEFGFVRSFTRLLSSISLVASDLDRGVVGEAEVIRHPIKEVDNLGSAFAKFSSSLKSFKERIEAQSRASAFAEVAEQVAHDLKSPLSALDMMLAPDNLTELPESRRGRIQACIQRIKDTLRVLSEKRKEVAPRREPSASTLAAMPSAPSTLSPVSTEKAKELISVMVEGIVQEKRIQYRETSGVDIALRLTQDSHFCFIEIHSNDFKRALSNLIDNAVQALPNKGGKVDLQLECESAFVHVLIKDTGKGIPEALLAQVGNRGATFGKEGGSGLGLWYAKTVVETAGGRLSLRSKQGVGTEIRITLPTTSAPNWFLPSLRVVSGTTMVLIDDDPTIHEMWIQKLAPFSSDIHLVHLRSGRELENWIATRLPSELGRAFFLFDFELGKEAKSGLDYIDQFKLGERSVLVTSHYEKPALRERALRLGVKLIPKEISGFVPFEIRRPGAGFQPGGLRP